MKFNENVRKLQREYYCGRITRQTATAMLGELMREFDLLQTDEVLVELPDDFGRSYDDTASNGFAGEFTIRQQNSDFTWKRSFVAESVILNESQSDDLNPVLTTEEEKFFAFYEEAMAKHIIEGGRRISARFFGVEFEIEK